MNTVLNSIKPDSLCISLRLLRLMLSALLIYAVVTEPTLSDFWQLLLSILAVYTFVTGVNGRDPVFAVFRRGNSRLPDNVLDVIAQLECLSIGLICFVGGMMHQNTHSLVFLLLPFFGIYPIVLCIVKHDLLGFLLQSYRR